MSKLIQPPKISFLLPVLSVIVFLATSLLRSPQLFLAPRFWAEEGESYYASLQSTPDFWSVVSLVINGNHQLGTNLVVWLSTLVPAVWAAHVTTAFSLLICFILAWQTGRLLDEYAVKKWIAIWASASLALLPQGYEIYFTATNMQWLMGASLMTVALLPLQEYKLPRLWAYYLWITLSGFSGIPSLMLTPLYAYRFWSTRSRTFLYPTVILSIAACVQVFVILHSSHDGRAFSFDPAILVSATILQTIWSPLASAGFTDLVIAELGRPFLIGQGLMVIAPISITLVFFLAKAAANCPLYRNYLLPIFAIWILVSTLNSIGSLGEKIGLVSGWEGGRYFYFGALCYLILVTMAANASSGRPKGLIMVLMAIMLSTSVAEIYTGRWHDFILNGPNWQQEVSQCEDNRPCAVNIWPRGWRFSLENP